MGCNVSKTTTRDQVVDIETKKREGARSGSSVSLPDWSPDAEKASSSSSNTSQSDSITIIHFNDVYNIEERPSGKEPIGGAARFKSQVDSLRHLEPLILFSGDALNPSNISIVTQGRHMVPIFKAIGVHAAVYGNHDFDFGVEHLASLAKEMSFPWLMSNARMYSTGKRLADGLEKLVLNWRGRKIGLMGLIEWEWIETLATLEPQDVDYTDYVEVARKLVPDLRQEGCDLIVALTHMRDPNDFRLAEEVPEIDLILGGHDHHYLKKWVGNVLVLKSGSDFREFSELTITFPNKPTLHPTISVKCHNITSAITPCKQVAQIVEEFVDKLKSGQEEQIGFTNCDLEGRFSYLRTQECNLGNLITDIMRRVTRTDVAILNSGTMRSDTVHNAGVFKMGDLMRILPMVDSISVLEVSGQQLIQALENGVSQYPKKEGRFPQVSGVHFSFDPSQPSGSRVIPDSVLVGGRQLELNRAYKLVTKGYIAQGRDGYDVFKDCKVLMSEEQGPILSVIVRNHFKACAGGKDSVDGFNTSSIYLGDGDRQIDPHVEGRIKLIESFTSS